MLDAERRRSFETGLVRLLVRLGASEANLHEDVASALDQALAAFGAAADDGQSLSALDVLRIRAGKFAAARLPASLYRDTAQLTHLRHEIRRLAEALLGPDDKRGSRF